MYGIKGVINHMALGAEDIFANTKVNFITVNAAVATSAMVYGYAANNPVGAAVAVGGVVTVASRVAGSCIISALADHLMGDFDGTDYIPPQVQPRLQKLGKVLILSFSLACGGAGAYAFHEMVKPPATPVAQAPAPAVK